MASIRKMTVKVRKYFLYLSAKMNGQWLHMYYKYREESLFRRTASKNSEICIAETIITSENRGKGWIYTCKVKIT